MRLIVRKRYAALLGLLLALLAASPAPAAELPPYELDPELSLTGDCSTSTFDPVPDPSCPYPIPPGGPSGRFTEPRAIAIDPFGNEYVASYAESEDAETRIDVFDDEGRFITEFATLPAKSIAVDSKGNLYLFEDIGKILRYEPSEYDPETGDIAYEDPPATVTTGSFVGALAVDSSNDHLVVAQGNVVTIYDSAENANAVLDVVGNVGSWVEAIALDPIRNRIYVTSCEEGKTTECGVKVLAGSDPYTVLEEIDGSTTPAGEFVSPFARMGLAVDEETGDFFVADIITAKTIYRFDENYEYLSQLKNNEFLANISIQIAVSNGERSPVAEPCEIPDPEEVEVSPGDACNRHYLFVPVLKFNGRAAAFHPPGQTPPVIEGVSAAGIGETEAELRATIAPGGVDTEYHFELTTQEAYEAKGFEDATVLGEGAIPAESLATEVHALATGLVPGETYRFRVVAENELGKAAEEGQNEDTFTTYDDAPVSPDCGNQELRTGPSVQLPDCRAYELVTPADTNGRAPKGVGFVGELFPTVESSPAGDAVWFKIEGGSVPGSSGVGSFEGDPYVATRGASGWSSELAGATGEEATVSIPGSSSPDQGYSFWSARIEGPLVINGEETQYLRYPDGHSELIGRGSLGTDPKARGLLITEGGTHVIFETINTTKAAQQLEPNAPPTGTPAIYDRTINPITGEEKTHVVSLLPGDITPPGGQNESYRGASPDGEGIAFEFGNTLYLRVGNETTYEIGENVDFAGVSEGGDRIFYVEGGDLKAFDTNSEEVVEFSATGDVIPVNVATLGARAYFVSPSVLGGANPEGAVAQPGKQNLYLSEEGAISFVATVSDRDVEGEAEGTTDGLGLWVDVLSTQPAKDPSRLNPDGSVLLFQSRANITGYEESAFPQIYRYDSGAGRLHCVSCIPTGTAASGGASLQTITFDSLDPPPLGPSGFVPNLTPAGKRVFFESTEALVSTDTDEVQDVYEWEEQGVGGCTRAGGCVYLISSGQSERDNFLYAHSESGDDVFFTTEDVLTDSDNGGAASIYDAKVGGGFLDPVEPEICVADGCRPSITPAPVFERPRAGGEGDVPRRAIVKRCPKGKRKVKKNGKVRCVKKKQHKGGKARQRGGASRGVAR
jgi:hypothetical protein